MSGITHAAPAWYPLLLNCPETIKEFFIYLGILFEESNSDQINENHCIVLSTWNSDSPIHWLDNLKLLRRKGYFNPVILVSFQNRATIQNQVTFSCEGICFLWLPFSLQDFDALTASLTKPDNSLLCGIRQQLCFENLCSSWISLRHGKQNEIINKFLVPLRMALLLDIEAIEKRKVLNQILSGPVTRYLHSPGMNSMVMDAKNLGEASGLEATLNQYFSDLNALLISLSNTSLLDDSVTVKKIDELIYTFDEIDKLVPKAMDPSHLV